MAKVVKLRVGCYCLSLRSRLPTPRDDGVSDKASTGIAVYQVVVLLLRPLFFVVVANACLLVIVRRWSSFTNF